MAVPHDPPHGIPLRDLERRCREENRRYRAQGFSDERFCLEIFRRALRRSGRQDGSGSLPGYADELARELLVLIYTDYIHAQISRRARQLVQVEDVVHDVWGYFWKSANDQDLVFHSLGAALQYLSRVTLTAVIRHTRKTRGQQREESLQAMAEEAGGERLLAPFSDQFDVFARRQFRRRCYACLSDPVARQIFHLRFGLGYMPREIAAWLNEHLEDRSAAYTARRVSDILERSFRTLSEDPEIRDLLQGD
jgi:DNA-directed RNA polymerase specialized sigma24 family protein